jgi:hypothetical protein
MGRDAIKYTLRDPTWLLRDLRTPFGGMKHSGVGREGGNEALRFFTETNNVCVKQCGLGVRGLGSTGHAPVQTGNSCRVVGPEARCTAKRMCR